MHAQDENRPPDIPADVLELKPNAHGIGFLVHDQLVFIVTGADGKRYERNGDGQVIELTRIVPEGDIDYED